MAEAMTDSSSCEVAFYEAFEEEELFLRKLLPAGHDYFFTWKTIQESGHTLPPARIISTRTQSEFPTEWAGHLDAILTRSTGYDHVSAYLKKTGAPIRAAYLPDYAARAVAEQALMLWMALIRNLSTQRESFSTFHRDGLTGGEVRGRTILVVGVGRIGSQIVDIAHGLGMNVLGVDLVQREEIVRKYALRYLSVEEGLPLADIVVCAVPLTDITRHWLDRKLFGGAKKGAIFINIARGEISPVPDLLALLEEGRLGGVGLDVYDCERELAAVLRGGVFAESLPPFERETVNAVLRLMKDPRAILTPHNAFNTIEAVERKSLHSAQNLEAYFEDGAFLTPIPELFAK